jgi:hypothetical protein
MISIVPQSKALAMSLSLEGSREMEASADLWLDPGIAETPDEASGGISTNRARVGLGIGGALLLLLIITAVLLAFLRHRRHTKARLMVYDVETEFREEGTERTDSERDSDSEPSGDDSDWMKADSQNDDCLFHFDDDESWAGAQSREACMVFPS